MKLLKNALFCIYLLTSTHSFAEEFTNSKENVLEKIPVNSEVYGWELQNGLVLTSTVSIVFGHKNYKHPQIEEVDVEKICSNLGAGFRVPTVKDYYLYLQSFEYVIGYEGYMPYFIEQAWTARDELKLLFPDYLTNYLFSRADHSLAINPTHGKFFYVPAVLDYDGETFKDTELGAAVRCFKDNKKYVEYTAATTPNGGPFTPKYTYRLKVSSTSNGYFHLEMSNKGMAELFSFVKTNDLNLPLNFSFADNSNLTCTYTKSQDHYKCVQTIYGAGTAIGSEFTLQKK